mgnify:CR=1 FL=1
MIFSAYVTIEGGKYFLKGLKTYEKDFIEDRHINHVFF